MIEEEEDKLEGKQDIIVVGADEDVVDDSPADCCPDPCYQKFPFLAGDDDSPFWQGWAMLRLKTFRLIENTYFETAVITMILLSSLALVCRLSTVQSIYYWFVCHRFINLIFSGLRRCTFTTSANPSRHPILYGQNLHSYLLPRDVDQVACSRLPEILYKRVVLARFCHCHGKHLSLTFSYNFTKRLLLTCI